MLYTAVPTGTAWAVRVASGTPWPQRADCGPVSSRAEVRFPRQHFDFKAFRKNLREKKQSLSAHEEREVGRRCFAAMRTAKCGHALACASV